MGVNDKVLFNYLYACYMRVFTELNTYSMYTLSNMLYFKLLLKEHTDFPVIETILGPLEANHLI